MNVNFIINKNSVFAFIAGMNLHSKKVAIVIGRSIYLNVRKGKRFWRTKDGFSMYFVISNDLNYTDFSGI